MARPRPSQVDLTEVVTQLLAGDRCGRCGVIAAAAGHPRSVCDAAVERNHLADDGWADLHQIWPSASPAIDAWPEHRSGPGWRRIYDGHGLALIEPTATPWVRTSDGDASEAAAACCGLSALRPNRRSATVLAQVLSMGEPGRRSLCHPTGFEVPMRCQGEVHRLSVERGRLLALQHPDLPGPRRVRHRHAVTRDWERALATTGLPLELHGLQVDAAPAPLGCGQAIEVWNAGLSEAHELDVTEEPTSGRAETHLQALLAAAVVMEHTSRAALIRELRRQAGSDVVLDLVTTFAAPGSTPSVAPHRILPAVHASIPANWALPA